MPKNVAALLGAGQATDHSSQSGMTSSIRSTAACASVAHPRSCARGKGS